MNLSIHKDLNEKMEKTLNACKDELMSVRAGRANPSLLDRVTIDYYGTQTPINQVANISAPEPRMILIQPWDASVLGEIEKSIQKSDLGLNPANDGKLIRLIIPQLTEERRIELTKLVKKIGENSKIALRNQRRDANDTIKKMVKDNEITEDEGKLAESEVQNITDKFTKEVDNVVEEKEKELLEV